MPAVFVDQDGTCLYVTEACNSNCIMCPMSIASRKRGNSLSNDEWQDIFKIIPEDESHITITGGEPFLVFQDLLPVIQNLSTLFPNAEVLILTNGRALAIKHIFQEILPTITDRFCFAIPVHGSTDYFHDAITQTPGSFHQTMQGLKKLSRSQAKIEIRIVGHKLNLSDINNTIKMLVDSDIRITTINIVAMEMTGCAAANRNKLWVDYSELFLSSVEGIRYAVKKGVDVGLYNFPFCAVPKEYWGLVKNSITPSKIRYYEECSDCKEYENCGGLFYSTYELKLFQVRPL